MPIKIFTTEELNPSEKTLMLIRQLAYSYKTLHLNKNKKLICLN